MPRSYHVPLLTAVATGAVAALAFSMRTPLVAQDTAPTYAKDVAPILNANCTGCHRPGGLGPFSLMDYDSVRANAADIEDAVKTGYMPPWHAEGPREVFSNDRRLSDLDKRTILRWLATGTKAGDLKKAPPKPVYATGWELGTPDAIVTMPEQFTVPAKGTVDYQYFEIPTNFTEDKWVDAIEFMPGAREVVHHVLVYARVPQPSQGQVTTAASATASPAPGAPPAARPRPLFVNQPHYETPPDPPVSLATSIRRHVSSARSSAARRPAPTPCTSPRARPFGCARAPCSRSRCTTRRTATKRPTAPAWASASRRKHRWRRCA